MIGGIPAPLKSPMKKNSKFVLRVLILLYKILYFIWHLYFSVKREYLLINSFMTLS